MKNENVGYMIIGISVLIIVIIFLFNSALKDIVSESCSIEGHKNCTMYDTISKQTYLSLSIVGLLIIVGLTLVFTKPDKEVIIKKIKESKPRIRVNLDEFREEEKKVFELIKENKAIFQADIIEKTGFGKAKVSRIIDKLEGNNLVERKRRGMTNIVVLKE